MEMGVCTWAASVSANVSSSVWPHPGLLGLYTETTSQIYYNVREVRVPQYTLLEDYDFPVSVLWRST